MSAEQEWRAPGQESFARHGETAGDGKTGLAIAAGVVAAVAGGVAWSLIVIWAHLEIGWAAWGVGALVGFAMGAVTAHRGPKLGATAAALACMGLLLGKLIITFGSTGAIAEEFLQDPEFFEGAMAWQMYDEGDLDSETMEVVTAAMESQDTLTDAVWAEMRQQAGVRLAAMNEEDRRELAQLYAGGAISNLGIIGAIWVQLSVWDLLWFGLALYTAFRMLSGVPEEQAEVAEEPAAA